MEQFVIEGGHSLSGTIKTGGSKNAALPIMTASLLTGGITILENVPQIADVRMMAHVLRITGARVDLDQNRMEIDTSNCSYWEAPYELVSKIRASIYVLGPLLARFGRARVSFPGGCAIGTRPIDLHLMAMEQLGAKIEITAGYIEAQADRLHGAVIEFPKVSVGATGNALMAAVLAEGETRIRNAAMEPEISALVDFLVRMGAKIDGDGTPELIIQGVSSLKPVMYPMLPDRIEAGTFVLAGAITGSEITVANCIPLHIQALLNTLKNNGFQIHTGVDSVHLVPASQIKPVDIQTQPYPDFPTDLQAQYLALMTLANGTTRIEETIFPDRFMHVAELHRLGAKIDREANAAIVHGVDHLEGAQVMATDLRASAALVLAGLAAHGKTIVSRIYHIDRGYENIETKLRTIGAKIQRTIA